MIYSKPEENAVRCRSLTLVTLLWARETHLAVGVRDVVQIDADHSVPVDDATNKQKNKQKRQ